MGPKICSRDQQKDATFLKLAGTLNRIDETYVKVGKQWKYLYRVLDKEGNTTQVYACCKARYSCGQTPLQEADASDHRRLPCSISVDKHASYPEIFTTMQAEKVLPILILN